MGEEVTMIGRRDLLVLGGLGALGLMLPGAAIARQVAAVVPRTITLPVGQRTTTMQLWGPADPRGVALFSHGHGSWPERYGQLAAALNAAGFAVLAPLHVDSVHYPDRDKFTLQQSFPERLADMAAASTYTARGFGGLPVVAVGHSFGTLTALCLGGALAPIGPFRNDGVRAVLGFSTPGRIPGLIQPSAYESVAVPVMIVTGTADTVPGFVVDPADHLFPAETVPTDSYALVVAGADHGLVAAPTFARAAMPAQLFLEGYGLGQRQALRALAAFRAAENDRWTIRKGKA